MEFDQKQQKIRKNAAAKNIRIRVYYICINYSRSLRKPVECPASARRSCVQFVNALCSGAGCHITSR